MFEIDEFDSKQGRHEPFRPDKEAPRRVAGGGQEERRARRWRRQPNNTLALTLAGALAPIARRAAGCRGAPPATPLGKAVWGNPKGGL